MVVGVSEGWTKELELVGVGYRATAQGQKLELALGFSHSVVMSLAQEVKVETVSEKGANPIIKLTSYDKQLVGQVAAKIIPSQKSLLKIAYLKTGRLFEAASVTGGLVAVLLSSSSSSSSSPLISWRVSMMP